MTSIRNAALTIAAVALCVGVVVGGGFWGCGKIKNFHRAQALKNAQNQVKLTHIGIQTANQRSDIAKANVNVVKQQANQRYWAATGVRRAQDEIQKTLTPLYVQWEGIQAEMKMAGSPNHTEVFVPTGTNGVPLVKTVP